MKQIVIDCAGITQRKDFHTRMAAALQFPDYYGHNLDALADCLSEVEEPVRICLENWDALEDALGDYTGKILRTLQIACQENPLLQISVLA